jgi:hypothetical protein
MIQHSLAGELSNEKEDLTFRLPNTSSRTDVVSGYNTTVNPR